MSDPEFTLLGDAIWLDFVNTTSTPPDGRDRLPDLPAYHRWTKASKLASDTDRVSFDEVLGLRRHLVALAEALDQGRQPRASTIQALNDVMSRTAGHQQLVRVNGAWRTRFAPSHHPLAHEAVAQSAAATLSEPLVRVRRCSGEKCGLFFADYSPNHSRRFCSAGTCGKQPSIERRRGDRFTPVV
jgi:predicted RNA-binding Zn ribbon-like protein